MAVPEYQTERLSPDSEGIGRAVDLLRRGELVAFPTETVYGLGADASNRDAVNKIYKAKGRPAGHPLIVHVASANHAQMWAAGWSTASSETARTLAETFWPGPLTLIVPRTEVVAPEVVGGRQTVGLRVPDEPVAQQLLQSFGGGIAAPSANTFGGVSPSTAQHVLDDLDGKIAAVIMAGPCEVGLESTIAEVEPAEVRVLRPGAVTEAMLRGVCGGDVVVADGRDGASRAPGMLASHYAPSTPLRIVSPDELDDLLALSARRYGVVTSLAVVGDLVWRLPADPEGFGRGLYAALRAADRGGVDEILVVPPSKGERFTAVMDRLSKAAG